MHREYIFGARREPAASPFVDDLLNEVPGDSHGGSDTPCTRSLECDRDGSDTCCKARSIDNMYERSAQAIASHMDQVKNQLVVRFKSLGACRPSCAGSLPHLREIDSTTTCTHDVMMQIDHEVIANPG